MKVDIDTNIFMAGLLKGSTVRAILNFADADFYLPEEGIIEVRKYADELCSKAGYTNEEFEELISELLENIRLISIQDTKPYLSEAEKIMEKIDIKDSIFLAAALAIEAGGIWSFDNHIKEQTRIRVLDT